jgi:hypothetical protein
MCFGAVEGWVYAPGAKWRTKAIKAKEAKFERLHNFIVRCLFEGCRPSEDIPQLLLTHGVVGNRFGGVAVVSEIRERKDAHTRLLKSQGMGID